MALLVGAGLVTALLLAYCHRPDPLPPPTITGAAITTRPPAQKVERVALVTVHVSGAVSNPGLVSILEGRRVADAVAAAGGVLPGGALQNINLAAPVTDGMQIVVGWADDGTDGRSSAVGADNGNYPVDVNSAGMDRLTDLPGVGKVLATRILTYRETNGPFGSLEDLLDVPGIGEGKLAGLRDYAVAGP